MPIWSPALFFSSASEEAYVIQDSVMFDGSADYLTLTFNDAGDTAKWTASVWIKRADISTGIIFEARADGNNTGALYFQDSDIYWQDYDDGVGTPAWRLRSDAMYRDPTAWMHLVIINDTGDSTSGDRQKIYVNGTRLTSFSTATYSSQGYASAQGINSTNPHYIGFSGSGDHFGGYMSEFIFLDGIAPSDASPFGETNDEGVWIPKDPSDTDNIADWGGGNSFWLKFADATNLGFNSRPTELTANAGTYKIDKSLWFDGTADRLTWTPSGASSTPDLYCISYWAKRATVGGTDTNVISGGSSGYDDTLRYTNYSSYTDAIQFYANGGTQHVITNAAFSDPTAWHHVFAKYDSANPVSADRMQLWVNGVRLTSFASSSMPSSGLDSNLLDGSIIGVGGYNHSATQWFDGYLADVIVTDGQDHAATNFGAYDATGVWVPIDPSGLTFGTNGFYLNFALAEGDGNGPGNDVSGNNNDFSSVGTISAAQTTTDSPTNTSADNEGNYTTFNSVDKNSNITLTGGNLTVTNTGSASFQGAIATQRIPNSGKYYFEVTLPGTLGNQYIGVVNEANKWDFVTAADGSTATGFYGFYPNIGTSYKVTNGSTSSYGGAIGTGSVLGFAIDKDNDEMYVSDDGTFLASSNPVTRASPMLSSLPDDLYVSQTSHNSGGHSVIFNFGQTAFAGSIPSGYVRLNTSELAAPTVTDPRKYFANMLYTGTAAVRSVRQCFDSTGTAWTPDFAWVKSRSNTTNFTLADSVRGSTKLLFTSATAAETTASDSITAFSEGGLTLGADSGSYVNTSAYTYVAYCMKAGGAASSNGNGSITSSVSAADHGGFSIGTFTAGSTGAVTIGHGLSRAPGIVIVKDLSATGQWWTFHEAIGKGKYLALQSTAAEASSTAVWNNTDPTATVFSTQDNGAWLTAGDNHVFYAFARTPGLIGIGSYTGNSSSEGPMVTVDDGASGFMPAWVMVKRTNGAYDWQVIDAARDPYNQLDKNLSPNLTSAEGTGYDWDFLANGFRPRASTNSGNNSSGTYIYLAFADQPFNLARAR